MTLFAPDLYRNFAIGFALGGLVVAAVSADEWADGIAPSAHAAEPTLAPPSAAQFWTIAE